MGLPGLTAGLTEWDDLHSLNFCSLELISGMEWGGWFGIVLHFGLVWLAE